MTTISILAAIPVRNRRELTLRFLETLLPQCGGAGVLLDILIIDDGSEDGTPEAIEARYPQVRVARHDGNLYWSGAAQRAVQMFLEEKYDFCWLLNDDIELEPDCLEALLSAAIRFPGGAYTGVVLDDAGKMLYGGQLRLPYFRFRLAELDDLPLDLTRVDAVNGNCLLLSREIALRMSFPAPGVFIHEAFDLFLGLEATRIGNSPIVVKNARCVGKSNPSKFSFYTTQLSLRERFRLVTGPKGVPPKMYWFLCRRFAGWLAPIYFLKPYIRVVFPFRHKKAV